MEDLPGQLHRLGEALVRLLLAVPPGVKVGDHLRDDPAAAGVVVQVDGLDEPLVQPPGLCLPQDGGPVFPPQQAKGGVGDAVFPHRGAGLVVVELPPADVKGHTVKVLRQLEDPPDGNLRLQYLQQRRAEDVVGVKPSGVGVYDLWDFPHEPLPFSW